MTATKIRQEQLRDIGGLTREIITQTGHDFVAKEALYYTGTAWARAKADIVSSAEVLGIVESVKGNDFTLVLSGRISGLSGLNAGSVYFLSWTTAGALTTVIPPDNMISKPLLVARSSTVGYVVNWRGLIGSGGGSVGSSAEVFSTLIGDGSATTYYVTPGVNTAKCLVQISDESTKEVLGGPERITLGYNGGTQVKIDFPVGNPPSTDQIRVVIVGIN